MSAEYKAFNHKEYQKNIGNNKFLKVLGWFFLIMGILTIYIDMSYYINWNAKKSNYSKEYVYSEFGTLYYETKEGKVYIKNIYNRDNERITIDIPDNKIIIMYIDKNNINEGIYFDLDNTIDQSMINPTISIFVSLFLVSMGLYFIITNIETKENRYTTKPLFLFYMVIFLIGIGIIISQIYDIVNFVNLKKQNNLTIATVYSEIYDNKKESDTYKSVAYYYVNGEKYIYVNETYEEGTLKNELGHTFELYYDQHNPSKVSKKENPIDIEILIIGICFTIFTFPFVFFRRKMERRFQKNMLKLENEREGLN